MSEQLEIPATIKFSIPFEKILAQIPLSPFMPHADDTVDEDADGPEKRGVHQSEEEVDYLEDREILRVEGIALMPGVYVGQNGLEAQYDHEVIQQDGNDLTGRPVGQMHEKDNAGYVHTTDVHEVTAELRIFTEVYDQEAIQGIRSGKYTGFSIDTKVWGYYQGSRFIVKKIGFLEGRVDLVDRPACQECLILDASEVPTSTAQLEQLEVQVTNRDDKEMVDISKEDHESLLAAKAELEQVKINQAAEMEAKIVKLIKEVKGKHPTFEPDGYLGVATDSQVRVAMLEALNEQLKEPTITDEEAEDITPPASGTQVAQSSEAREIEVSTYDVEAFLKQQFKEHLNTDIALLKGIDEFFAESYESMLPEEARQLIEFAGDN